MGKVSIPAGVGMDGRHGTQSPWRFLCNMYPKSGRLHRISSAILDSRMPVLWDWYSGGVAVSGNYGHNMVLGSVSMALYGKRTTCVVTLCYNKVQDDYRICYTFLSDDVLPGTYGLTAGRSQYVAADISAYDPDPQNYNWMVKAIGNRVWLSGGNFIYVLTIDNPVPAGAGTLVETQGTIGAEVFRFSPIDDTAEWPSLDSDFGCGIIEAHQNTMFYAGFRGERLYYSKDLTDNQQALVGTELEADSLKALPNMLTWGRGNNPFAISIQRFVYVGSGAPIRALCGFKDTMLIFTDDEIWALRGAITPSPQLRRMISGIGADGKHAVCSTEYGVVFTHNGRIYIADEERVVNIGQPVEHTQTPTSDGLVPTMDVDRNARIVYSSAQKRAYISVATGGNTDPNVLVFDFDEGAWFAMALPVLMNFGADESEEIYDTGDMSGTSTAIVPDAGRILFFSRPTTVTASPHQGVLHEIEMSGESNISVVGNGIVATLKSYIMSNEANPKYSDVRIDSVNVLLDEWSPSVDMVTYGASVQYPTGTTSAMTLPMTLYTFPSGVAQGLSVPTGVDPYDIPSSSKYTASLTWADLEYSGMARGGIEVPISFEEESFRFELHMGEWYYSLVPGGSTLDDNEDARTLPKSTIVIASIEVDVNDRGPVY